MWGVALRSILGSLPVLLIVSLITFGLMRLIPGDPAAAIAGMSATADQLALIRKDLGLDEPFVVQLVKWYGGLLQGNLGRSVIKISAVPEAFHVIEAPARVFDSQDELQAAFKAGELEKDVVCVVRWQGPQANGMPELHKLTPPLAVLQGKGFKVALVTDGRMSGASGKVPAAIHVSPEAADGGPLAKVQSGDLIRLDAVVGTLQVLVPEAEWNARPLASMPEALRAANGVGMGRELFANLRRNALKAEEGACTWL